MGVPDMAWPRLNNFSFWMLLPASMCLAWGLLHGRVGSGWTIYPPLSALETPMDAMIFSLHLARISSILGAINFLTTILMNGPKGFSMYNLSLFILYGSYCFYAFNYLACLSSRNRTPCLWREKSPAASAETGSRRAFTAGTQYR